MATIDYQAFHPTLTNVQRDLLKVFAMQLPEDQLLTLRAHIARFLMDKARGEATQIWQNKGYNEATMEALLSGKNE